MAQQEEGKQPPSIDEETLKSIEKTLYNRLREPLLLELRERLMEQAAEQPIPLYYDRFIASQTQRLEEAIERNAQRIMELRQEIDRRFEEINRRFEEMDQRFTEAKEEREALRAEMTHRFTGAKEEREALRAEMNHRFEAMETRIEQLGVQMRNWALLAVALVSAIVAVLQLVLR